MDTPFTTLIAVENAAGTLHDAVEGCTFRFCTVRLNIRNGCLQGEAQTLEAFKKDPYACRGPLREKRAVRDPFSNGTPASTTCPKLTPFLNGKCTTTLYKGGLPWSKRKSLRGKTLMEGMIFKACLCYFWLCICLLLEPLTRTSFRISYTSATKFLACNLQ